MVDVGRAAWGAILGGIVGYALLPRWRAYLERRSPRAFGVRFLRILPLVLCVFWGWDVGDSEFVSILLDHPSPRQRAARSELRSGTIRSKALEKRLLAVPTTSAAHDLAVSLANAGFKRLPPAALVERAGLKLQLAELSASVCAGYWSGELSESILTEALDKMPEHEARRWAAINVDAMVLEAEGDNQNRRAAPMGVVSLEVFPRCSAEESARLKSVSPTASGPEACWAFRTLLRKVLALPEENRDLVLRHLEGEESLP